MYSVMLIFAASAAAAAEPQHPNVTPLAILACGTVSSDQERLKCFDREAKTLADAIRTQDIAVISREEVRKTRRSLFGLSLPNFNLFGKGQDEKVEKNTDVDRLDTSIVAVSESGVGCWRLTLLEGGVWETTEPDRNFFPRKGRSILIERRALGSYWAKIAGDARRRIRRIG